MELIAKIDNYDERWESGELERVFCSEDRKEEVINWLLTNCACTPETVEEDDIIFEETIIKTSGYIVNFDETPMVEYIKLYKI